MQTHKTKPHSKDLRKGRYSQNNQIYLVTTVTEKREQIFLDFALGRWVVQAMRRQQEQEKVQSLAFVVMPDHLHWLFALQNDWSLAKVMQSVKGISSCGIQKIRRGLDAEKFKKIRRYGKKATMTTRYEKKKTCNNSRVILWQTR